MSVAMTYEQYARKYGMHPDPEIQRLCIAKHPAWYDEQGRPLSWVDLVDSHEILGSQEPRAFHPIPNKEIYLAKLFSHLHKDLKEHVDASKKKSEQAKHGGF